MTHYILAVLDKACKASISGARYCNCECAAISRYILEAV